MNPVLTGRSYRNRQDTFSVENALFSPAQDTEVMGRKVLVAAVHTPLDEKRAVERLFLQTTDREGVTPPASRVEAMEALLEVTEEAIRKGPNFRWLISKG